MTNLELQQLVEEISQKYFHQPFTHKAFFNPRLRTTGGRYHLNDHHLDINPLVYQKYGREELVAVIKHELCHYHLHLAGKGYHHGDADFKQLLARTGGSRYVLPLKENPVRWCYHCSKCGEKLYRQRRINTKRYVCGKCHGKLVLEGRRNQSA